jgi:hypothetical protein
MGQSPMLSGLQKVYSWEGGRPIAGETRTLFYNRDASDLRHRKDLTLHLGCNGWDSAQKVELPLTKVPRDSAEAASLGPGDWYSAAVPAPKRARVLDFVLSDSDQRVWDNNGNKDFHTLVSVKVDRKAMEEQLYQKRLQASLPVDSESAARAGALDHCVHECASVWCRLRIPPPI